MDSLYAHVLVHEITDMLEGVEHHSETGVMKAHWTEHDVADMSIEPLSFEPIDVKLIEYGLAHYCIVGRLARSEWRRSLAAAAARSTDLCRTIR
jgi:hypothetical protein